MMSIGILLAVFGAATCCIGFAVLHLSRRLSDVERRLEITIKVLAGVQANQKLSGDVLRRLVIAHYDHIAGEESSNKV